MRHDIYVPTYTPFSTPATTASFSSSKEKYGLYLYHEGWKKIDYYLHLIKLLGVPILFIRGNGGSYMQAYFRLYMVHIMPTV